MRRRWRQNQLLPDVVFGDAREHMSLCEHQRGLRTASIVSKLLVDVKGLLRGGGGCLRVLRRQGQGRQASLRVRQGVRFHTSLVHQVDCLFVRTGGVSDRRLVGTGVVDVVQGFELDVGNQALSDPLTSLDTPRHELHLCRLRRLHRLVQILGGKLHLSDQQESHGLRDLILCLLPDDDGLLRLLHGLVELVRAEKLVHRLHQRLHLAERRQPRQRHGREQKSAGARRVPAATWIAPSAAGSWGSSRGQP
mmetsp:Transcript_83047/g.220020  ORF Transcript_83047/g.220020 Transcript_83047/m.220020 type:complete len:250 (+) Transcript_83047:436-1185(+)